ncbi:MAG: Organic hydroperoxide resistance transcriptional regulator [Candidatus Heimdallarchaeota archaeon LC_3]|nr:MAG: Organic hydroperoxide resistance transcriptional regulator [Candidatus Heimdallarchaeota archaeon LC_3]
MGFLHPFGKHHNFDELSKEFLMLLVRAELQKSRSQAKLLEIVDKLGITKSEFLMIKFLKNSNNILVKELADQLNLSNSTIVERLNSLEDVGMIKRERNFKDRRKVMISLTEKSMKIVNQVDMNIFDFIPHFFDELNSKEKLDLLQLFKKVNLDPKFSKSDFQEDFSKRLQKLIGF